MHWNLFSIHLLYSKPASVATAIEVICVITTEPEWIENLWSNTYYARNTLKQEHFDLGSIETPILPVFIGVDELTFRYAQKLLEKGVFVTAVVYPAVSKNKGILRFSIMSTLTRKDIDQAVDALVAGRYEINSMWKNHLTQSGQVKKGA